MGVVDEKFEPLLSPRLTLRRFTTQDLPAFCRYRSNPEVARYQSWDTFTEADGTRFLAEQRQLHPGTPETWFQLAFEQRATGELVGDAALHCLPGESNEVEFGFTLAPEHRRRGYATEGVARLLDYVFSKLDRHRAFAVIDTRNTSAAAVVERLGLRLQARLIDRWFKGEWTTEYTYAILQGDWAKKYID